MENWFHLAESLFKAKTPNYRFSSFKIKAAVIYFSTYSGMRWGDLIRLKWQDLQKVVRPHVTFIIIKLKSSKTEWDGATSQAIVLPLLGKNYKWNCPVLYCTSFGCIVVNLHGDLFSPEEIVWSQQVLTID